MSLNTSLRRATSSTGPSTALSKTLRSSSPTPSTSSSTYICNQCRHATLLRRPKRPYTFTQLIALSDGSTFLHRTTSPMPVYRSTRDTRNSLLWNPTSKKLLNVEDDEAGRLAAFRTKFGRGFDAVGASSSAETEAATMTENKKADEIDLQQKSQRQAEQDAAADAMILAQEEAELQEEEDNLLDLISSFGQEQQNAGGKKK